MNGQVTNHNVIYRNTVVENIQNKFAVVSLVADNLALYMDQTREMRKGKEHFRDLLKLHCCYFFLLFFLVAKVYQLIGALFYFKSNNHHVYFIAFNITGKQLYTTIHIMHLTYTPIFTLYEK